MSSGHKMRQWQSWDKADTAQLIDRYWASDTLEINFRRLIADDIRQQIGRKVSILEVGCGSGLIYAALLKNGVVTPKLYIGGDISVKMLEIARKRFPKVNFLLLDALALPFPDKSQPNVICVQVLQHLPGYEEAVRELLRVTTHKLYIATLFSLSNEDQITLGDTSWGGPFYNNHYSLPKFLGYIYQQVGNRIEQTHIRHLIESCYSVTLKLT